MTDATTDEPSGRHPKPRSHRGDGLAVVVHFAHRGIPLRHKAQLHQYSDPLQPGNDDVVASEEAQHRLSSEAGCNTATGASVAQLPEPRPRTGTQQPEPTCPL